MAGPEGGSPGRSGQFLDQRLRVLARGRLDADGQIIETHSVSAGLDYPGVGPEHAWLKDTGRAQYVAVTDAEALAAFHHLTRTEGILPALESAHAVAEAIKRAPGMEPDQIMIVNISGRGDKDMMTVAAALGFEE